MTVDTNYFICSYRSSQKSHTQINQLQNQDVEDSFDVGTDTEFDEWLNGEHEGFFFLDSVDEARLKDHSAFKTALKKFAKSIRKASNRTKVFVSCRVSEWRATSDLDFFLRILPMPKIVEAQSSDETAFGNAEQNADMMIIANRTGGSEKKEDPVVFQLAPLDYHQIHRFVDEKGVENAKGFIESIREADAWIFAERPQDLLDMIGYWESHTGLGSHAVMLDYNIRMKLAERDPKRDIQDPLSLADAFLGAERLATAITLQKKNSIILPDRESDGKLRRASVDPKEILQDWKPSKTRALLDRAIFDEAIYGTVQFHHRSVREYLTAKWLERIIDNGSASRRSLEGLIFASKYGNDVVIPSMRSVAAWLAGFGDEGMMSRLREIAPEVLIEHGDPSMLPVEFRESLLVGFTELYAEHSYSGASFDIAMCRRLADPRLAPTINELLGKHSGNDEICTLLLDLIWQGRISESADTALTLAIDDETDSYVRGGAIHAVAAAGNSEQRRKLVETLMKDPRKIGSRMLGEFCELFFPDILSIPELLKIMKIAGPPKLYSFFPLEKSVVKLIGELSTDEDAEIFLRGVHNLLKSPPFNEKRLFKISNKHYWLLPIAIKLASRFIKKKHPLSFDPMVLDLFLDFLNAHPYRDFGGYEREGILDEAKTLREFGYRLFWQAVSVERCANLLPAAWMLRGFWVPSVDDLERLFEDIKNRSLMSDRCIAITVIFQVYVQEGRPRKLRERMKREVAGEPELENKLGGLFRPKLTEEQKKWQRKEQDYKRRREAGKKREETKRRKSRKVLMENPDEILKEGNAMEGQVGPKTLYLYNRIWEKKNAHHYGYSDWRVLIDEFGLDVAKSFRDGCVAYWRGYDPLSISNNQTTNAFPGPRTIGLCGLAMESADDPDWTAKLTGDEAANAARYSICEMNGFPAWVNEFRNRFPDQMDAVIENELRWELQESKAENISTRVLSALRYHDEELRNCYREKIFGILSEKEPENDMVLDNALSIILEGNVDDVLRKKLSKLARKRFESANRKRKFVWLFVLLYVDGDLGFKFLKEWINGLPSDRERKETMIDFCAGLTYHGDSRFGSSVRDYERIEVLGELLPLIYQYVRVEEDVRHEGDTPDKRENAGEARSRLLGVIVNTPGRSSYDALMNLSKSTTHVDSRDRLIYLAKERTALDAEPKPWSGHDISEFAKWYDREPKNEADLFELALMRLDDLKLDFEKGDYSDAALLRRAKNEDMIRNTFVNRLRKSSRFRYTVNPEEELADKTRPDIRFHAPHVSAPVPVELKIADNWPLAELRERMENQLIGQYMRVSRYGIFLVVNQSKKYFYDTRGGKRKKISFTKLIEILKQDAGTLKKKYSAKVDGLEVVGIDFTIR